MPRQLRVHMLPEHLNPHEMAGNTYVVIDVLRASTTIAYAIAAGAQQVIPCLEIAEAREMARKLDSPLVLLGGERGGLPIAGFDLGNSPRDYTHDRVEGSVLCLTTTNGTRALMRCVGAGQVFIGSFANLKAVGGRLAKREAIELLCAGTNGQVTREDVLFAGAVVSRQLEATPSIELNDCARIALDAWRAVGGDGIRHEALARELADSLGGRNLTAVGMESDIEVAATIDAVDVLPELVIGDWRIVPSTDAM